MSEFGFLVGLCLQLFPLLDGLVFFTQAQLCLLELGFRLCKLVSLADRLGLSFFEPAFQFEQFHLGLVEISHFGLLGLEQHGLLRHLVLQIFVFNLHRREL